MRKTLPFMRRWSRGLVSYLTTFPSLRKTAEEFLLFGDPESNMTLDLPVGASVEEWADWEGW